MAGINIVSDQVASMGQNVLGGAPAPQIPGGTESAIQNTILTAMIAANSAGVEDGAIMMGNGGSIPLLYGRAITGRYSDKFAKGWLGGVGGSSQFQAAQGSRLPVLPPSTNRDLEWRIEESRGTRTGEHLMTRWERPNNFNPGWGTDTWREGVNVTWDLLGRGLVDPLTGVMGPLSYPALSNRAAGPNPLPPYDGPRQGLVANQTAPAVVVPTSTYRGGVSMGTMGGPGGNAQTAAGVANGSFRRR